MNTASGTMIRKSVGANPIISSRYSGSESKKESTIFSSTKSVQYSGVNLAFDISKPGTDSVNVFDANQGIKEFISN